MSTKLIEASNTEGIARYVVRLSRWPSRNRTQGQSLSLQILVLTRIQESSILLAAHFHNVQLTTTPRRRDLISNVSDDLSCRRRRDRQHLRCHPSFVFGTFLDPLHFRYRVRAQSSLRRTLDTQCPSPSSLTDPMLKHAAGVSLIKSVFTPLREPSQLPQQSPLKCLISAAQLRAAIDTVTVTPHVQFTVQPS